MATNVGNFDSVIEWLEQAVSKGSAGQAIKQWVTKGTAYASVESANIDEVIENNSSSRESLTITTYQIDGISTSSWAVRHNGQLYDITSISPIRFTSFLTVQAEQRNG